MNTMSVFCPSCQSPVSLIGSIADACSFAGRSLDSPLSGGYLYQCLHCRLNFRWPQLTKDSLDALYKGGNDKIAWHYVPSQRKDWTITKTIIQNATECIKVLDVGCFDGAFLSFLGQEYERYGIEIHPAAYSRAEAAGVTMIARDLEDIKDIDRLFDCVISMDVVEHVADPLNFLEKLVGVTKPGGKIILSTGNTDSWPWKIAGSRYWYCQIAEHISFINPMWCNYAAQEIGLSVKQISTFSHKNASVARRIKELAINLAYLSFPAVGRLLRKKGVGGINMRKFPTLADVPPGWHSAHDHLLVVFQKP